MATKAQFIAPLKKVTGRKKDVNTVGYQWMYSKLTNFDKIKSVKSGISKDEIVILKTQIDIDYDHLAAILGTTKTTLHKKNGEEVFGPSISEKAIALRDIYTYGYEVFEDEHKFNEWIQTKNKALGDHVPLEVMDTFFGIDEVKNIITRIEHGVYS